MNIIKRLKKIWQLRKKGVDVSETVDVSVISSGISDDAGKDEAFTDRKGSIREIVEQSKFENVQKTVETNTGEIPLEDCLDIVAMQNRFDDYSDVKSQEVQTLNTVEVKGKIYNRTLEDLERAYEGKEEDEQWFQQQAVLGTEEEGLAAYDEDGNFHCINWFDCQFCPAFNPNHCI